jgi:hypothetical protein
MASVAILRRSGAAFHTATARCVHSTTTTTTTATATTTPGLVVSSTSQVRSKGVALLAAAPPATVARGGAFAWYNAQIEARPFITKSITCGLICGAADITCQFLNKPAQPFQGIVSVLEQLEVRRAVRFALCGAFITTPIFHVWFNVLSKTFPASMGTRGVAGKLTADMLVCAVPFNVVFITGVFASEGLPLVGVPGHSSLMRSTLDGFDRCIPMIPAVMRDYYFVWGPAQLINFAIVPLPFQVLFANGVAFFWNCYLVSQVAADAAKVEPTKVHGAQKECPPVVVV